MKIRKLWVAVLLLAPAMAMAQEKYTNADLDKLRPSRDAYTNADLEKLAPLPVQGRALEPLAPATVDLLRELDVVAAENAAYKRNRELDLDLIAAEIRYWERIRDRSLSGLSSNPNDWPIAGPTTSIARNRIHALERLLHLVTVESERLP